MYYILNLYLSARSSVNNYIFQNVNIILTNNLPTKAKYIGIDIKINNAFVMKVLQ